MSSCARPDVRHPSIWASPIVRRRGTTIRPDKSYVAGRRPARLAELPYHPHIQHSSPSSTQHYARITPTKLTKAYTDAGYFARNVRTIGVLLDRDAITNGQAAGGGPFEFYDLGHGYCSYSFFEQCPHRMACARCDFYLPKLSSERQLLEAKDGIQRMVTEIPLTDGERAAVDGDQVALDALLDRLADIATPAGPTRVQLRPGSAGDLPDPATQQPALEAGDAWPLAPRLWHVLADGSGLMLA